MGKIAKTKVKSRRKFKTQKGKGLDLYTIIMWDEDAPSVYLHWLSVNIPGKPVINERRIHGGTTLMRYTPPAPPPGPPHHYHISIYKQSSYINHKEQIGRVGFDVDSFVKQYDLQIISDTVKLLGRPSV